MHEISIALLANKKRSKRLIYKRKNMEELFKAIEENNIGTVKLLLEWGADINAIDQRGETALMYAAMAGHTEIATTLIELGADIPEDKSHIIRTLKQPFWWTGSHTAVMNNRLDDIQNFGDQSSPITPLDLAIMIGNLEAVEHILERRANSPTLFSSSNGTNFGINDCLNKAIKAKRNDIAMFFLEKGADPTAGNQLGQTSLHIACSYGNKDIIPILIEHMNQDNTNPRP
jgi:ankyrin repeat protein